jgi:hypothetical protein
MHYANGQEAKLGDLVVLRKHPLYPTGTETVGRLVQGTGSGWCNGQMQPLAQRFVSDIGTSEWMPVPQAYPSCVTIGELMPIDLPNRPAAVPA